MVMSSLGKGLRRYTCPWFLSHVLDMSLSGEGNTEPAQWVPDFSVRVLKGCLKRKEGMITIFKW